MLPVFHQVEDGDEILSVMSGASRMSSIDSAQDPDTFVADPNDSPRKLISSVRLQLKSFILSRTKQRSIHWLQLWVDCELREFYFTLTVSIELRNSCVRTGRGKASHCLVLKSSICFLQHTKSVKSVIWQTLAASQHCISPPYIFPLAFPSDVVRESE